VLPQDN